MTDSGLEVDVATPARRSRRSTVVRAVLAVIVLAVLVVAVSSERGNWSVAARRLGHLHWQWVPLAVLAESASMAFFARLQRRLLSSGGTRSRLSSVLAITYAGNAISSSIPLAGSELSVAYTFRELGRRGTGRTAVVVALTVSGVLSTVTLSLIVAAGAITSGNTAAVWSGLSGAAVVVGLAVLAVVARSSPPVETRLASVAVGVLRLFRRVTRRGPTDAADAIDRVRVSLRTLRFSGVDLAVATFFAAANWITDVACLALSIRSCGLHVPSSRLILAWSAGSAVSSLGLTPGGIGVVEAALVSALVATGLSTSGATTAVILYRLISLWLPMVIGWFLYLVLRQRRDRAAGPAR